MEKNEQAHAGYKKMRGIHLLLLSTLLLLTFNSCSTIRSYLFYEDPLTAEEHNNLGVAYEKEGKYKLAKKEYKMAVDKDGELIVAMINLGNIYFKEEEFNKAEKYYLRALEENPESIFAANNLGNLYLRTEKNYEEGVKHLNQAISDESPASALDTLAMLYYKLGDREKAKELLFAACEKIEEDTLKEEINKHLREIGEETCNRQNP